MRPHAHPPRPLPQAAAIAKPLALPGAVRTAGGHRSRAIEPRVARPWFERLQRWGLRKTIPYPRASPRFLRFGPDTAPLVCHPPSNAPVPPRQPSFHGQRRRMHERCWCLRAVFSLSWRPVSTCHRARVLDRLNINLSAATGAGCCGAASCLTSGVTEGLDFARHGIECLVVRS